MASNYPNVGQRHASLVAARGLLYSLMAAILKLVLVREIETHLHLREESIDAGDCVEEDVGRQVVPHLEAPQDVRGPVAHPAGDRRGLNDPRRDGGHLSRRRLD